MTRRDKLYASIRSNPKDVAFADACRAAEMLGFKHKGSKGSHNSYSRTGELIGLNFQNRDGKIPPYQAKQLIAMLDKYAPDDDE